MKFDNWDSWSINPDEEKTKLRVKKKLPTMECTKQLKKIISKIYKPKMEILDFGCASGHYYLELSKLSKNFKYMGYDATKNYINFAKKHFKNNKNVNFKVESLLSRSIKPKQKFDIVYCCNVLLHLPELKLPIRNLLSRTKKYCIIRTLVDEHTHTSQYLVRDIFDKKGNPTHMTYQNTYSYNYIKKTIKDYGNYNIKFENDVFNKNLINEEYKTINKKTNFDKFNENADSTKVYNNLQISGSKVFNWKWVIIEKK